MEVVKPQEGTAKRGCVTEVLGASEINVGVEGAPPPKLKRREVCSQHEHWYPGCACGSWMDGVIK